jgi:hypothetical protein
MMRLGAGIVGYIEEVETIYRAGKKGRNAEPSHFSTLDVGLVLSPSLQCIGSVGGRFVVIPYRFSRSVQIWNVALRYKIQVVELYEGSMRLGLWKFANFCPLKA